MLKQYVKRYFRTVIKIKECGVCVMRIGLVPLDERPCNKLFPRMIGETAGVSVITPPRGILGKQKQPGDFERLKNWLRANIASFDALVLSVDQLVYGGLVPSRLTHQSEDDCLDRLAFLGELRTLFPNIPFYGFNVITRIPNYNLALEEPEYWNDYGSMIYAYSQYFDLAASSNDSQIIARKEQLAQSIPEEVLHDVLWRRRRNHQLNVAALELVHGGVLDSLLLTLDDTSQNGLPRLEREILESKTHELGLEDKVRIHPGADEVAALLVSKALLDNCQLSPRYFIHYESQSGADVVALYEDRPIQESVHSQIKSSGGLVAETVDAADIILFVNTPHGQQGESWDQDKYTPEESDANRSRITGFVKKLKEHQDLGHHVAVADLAYANGSDRELIHALQEFSCLTQLCSYGAWNTASNTLGTVVAHSNTRWLAQTILSSSVQHEKAHFQFLLLRFIDDWLYQSVVRTEIRETFGSPHELGANWPAAEEFLNQRILGLYTPFFKHEFLGHSMSLLPGKQIQGCKVEHLQLPWKRTFEMACRVTVEIG